MSLWLCCFFFLFGTTNFYAKSFAVLNMVALLLFHRNVKGLARREPICCFQTNNSIGAKAPATVCSGSGPSDPAIPCRSRPILFFPGAAVEHSAYAPVASLFAQAGYLISAGAALVSGLQYLSRHLGSWSPLGNVWG